MKNIIKLTLLNLSLLFLFYGCAGSTSYINYTMNMTEVERPSNPKIQYGTIKTTRVDETSEDGKKTTTNYQFEDDLINGFFYFTSTSIGFQMKNKTQHTMKVHWDNCAFITSSGETMRVIHTGVKLTDRNAPQPSSVIVRNGKLTDSMTPSDNIYYVSGQYGGWRYNKLFEDYSYVTGDMNKVLEKAKTNYIGKSCSVLLSFEIEGVINDYIFNFDIENVELKSLY